MLIISFVLYLVIVIYINALKFYSFDTKKELYICLTVVLLPCLFFCLLFVFFKKRVIRFSLSYLMVLIITFLCVFINCIYAPGSETKSVDNYLNYDIQAYLLVGKRCNELMPTEEIVKENNSDYSYFWFSPLRRSIIDLTITFKNQNDFEKEKIRLNKMDIHQKLEDTFYISNTTQLISQFSINEDLRVITYHISSNNYI